VTVLSEQERLAVSVTRQFVDDDVRPAVRDLEHANEYPDKLIDQMKGLGLFGTAIPEAYGGNPVSTSCYVLDHVGPPAGRRLVRDRHEARRPAERAAPAARADLPAVTGS
jgi:alkylation response protein AidB-like acyl-CoA dehydrogenase